MDTEKCNLPKEERISRKLIIDKLFAGAKSFVAYPLRVVYLVSLPGQTAEKAILISVSKRRFKRAVKRNLLKRRIKEAYRLNKNSLHLPEGVSGISIAFLYVSKEIVDFSELERKMKEIIERLNRQL
jgi:ribonuclease P protein component